MSSYVPSLESTAFPTAVAFPPPPIPTALPMAGMNETWQSEGFADPSLIGFPHGAKMSDKSLRAPVPPRAPTAPVSSAPPATGGVFDTASAAVRAACTVGKEALASLTTEGYGGPSEKPLAGKTGMWIPIQQLKDKRDEGIIGALLQLVEARTMSDHWEAFGNAQLDVGWDAPPVLLVGREAMRCMVYWAKSAAEMTFDVIAMKKDAVDVSKGIDRLTMQVVFYVKPRGLLRLLATEIPIQADVSATVARDKAEPMDSPGRIQAIWGRWHNLPILPWPMRSISGLLMGHLTHMTEGLWGNALSLLPAPYKDESYRHHGIGRERPL